MVRPCGEKHLICSNGNMEVGGHREIGRLKLRWSDVIRRHGGETTKDRRSTRPENVEIENSTWRPQIDKRPKKKSEERSKCSEGWKS